MKRLALLLLVLTVALTSCEDDKKLKDGPPPTTSEIRSALDSAIQGLKSGNIIPVNEAKDKIREVRNQYGSGPNWQQAYVGFVGSVSEETKSIYDFAKENEEAWPKVLVWCEVLEEVDPDNVKLPIYRKKANSEINKPKVAFKGVMNDGIFVKIELRLENETYSEVVRMGQEIHGIKIVEVIGRGKGIVIEYLETHEIKEVMLGQ